MGIYTLLSESVLFLLCNSYLLTSTTWGCCNSLFIMARYMGH